LFLQNVLYYNAREEWNVDEKENTVLYPYLEFHTMKYLVESMDHSKVVEEYESHTFIHKTILTHGQGESL
jgi:hypothetical protein